jgi:hypothetical protein
MSPHHTERLRFLGRAKKSENRGERLELAWIQGIWGLCIPFAAFQTTLMPGFEPSRPGVCHPERAYSDPHSLSLVCPAPREDVPDETRPYTTINGLTALFRRAFGSRDCC